MTGRTSADAGRRILYLDDEQPIVSVATRLLSRSGHHVDAYTDAAAALDRFRTHPDDYDVVVTDLSMPAMSGLDFARSVLGLRPGLPVILATGWLRPEDERRAAETGILELVSEADRDERAQRADPPAARGARDRLGAATPPGHRGPLGRRLTGDT